MLSFADTAHFQKRQSINDAGLRRLALGLLLDSLKQAASGDVAAREFLLSEDAGLWACVAGLPAWPPIMGGVSLADALRDIDGRALPSVHQLLYNA